MKVLSRTTRLLGLAAVLCFVGESFAAQVAQAPQTKQSGRKRTQQDQRYYIYVSGIT